MKPEEVEAGRWYTLTLPNGAKVNVRTVTPRQRQSRVITSWHAIDENGLPYQASVENLSPKGE